MRVVARLWLVFWAPLAGLAVASDSYPYTAAVTVDDAVVRSGPGRVHYATDRLPRESHVQVWRHDPGGWCAIRPPEGSFSLVPLRKLHLTDVDDVAEVAEDNVTVWTGSRLGEMGGRMWQVLLDRGEPVHFLGKMEKPDAATGVVQVWAKIAPPAGEFRWIHADHISVTEIADQPAPSLAAVEPAMREPDGGWTQRSIPRAIALRENLTLTSLVEQTGATIPVEPPEETHGRPLPKVAAHDDFYADLDALEVQLSLMVSGSPETWQFDELRQRATGLIGRSHDDTQRGQARLIVDRINAFDSIQRRLQSDDSLVVTAAHEPAGDDSVLDSLMSEPVGTGVQPASLVNPSEPRYDGKGWLIEVHSRQPGAPKYALADALGEVRQYVTPAAGVNLHRYLNEEVGVFGKQGIIQDLGTPHVTVRRVIVLSRHR